MQTSNSVANQAVLNAQNDRRGLGPIDTCNSGPEVFVLNAKTTDEGWDQYRLITPMLIILFCIHKTTGEVLDP